MRKRSLGWICVFGLVVQGCGGNVDQPATKDEMRQTALADVGELYRMYVVTKKKTPRKVADFAPLERMSPAGFLAVRGGDIVVRFEATLPDTQMEPGKSSSDEVLAYEKSVPGTGGQVLMLNRTIRAMTPDEFKAAKLAGASSSADASSKAARKTQ